MAQPRKNSQHIREIQQCLQRLSCNGNSSIPEIIPDGIYDERTAEAVRKFQKEHGLPETGKVDPRTWDTLFQAHERLLKEHQPPMQISPFPSARSMIGPGSAGTVVYILQAILDHLSEQYANLPKVIINGQYDKSTENAVKEFQKRSGMDRNGRVNRDTWDILAKTYNARKREEEIAACTPEKASANPF